MFQLWLQSHYRRAPRQRRTGSHIWRTPRRSDSSGAAALKMTSCPWCIFNCVRNGAAFYPQVGHVSCLSYSPLCTLCVFWCLCEPFLALPVTGGGRVECFPLPVCRGLSPPCSVPPCSVLEHILEASGMISARSGSPFMALCAMKEPSASVGEIIIRHGLEQGRVAGAGGRRHNLRLCFHSQLYITAFMLIHI